MATYRIVDMYRKSKAVKGIHYDSQDNPILAYRVDKRHSLLFGLMFKYGIAFDKHDHHLIGKL